jgi:tRNA A58 N-methylase Trm61
VERGNQVVIVGGGWGLSTVTAARSVGKEGSVVRFKSSESAVRNVEETVHLNDVSERSVIRYAIVSHAYSLRGEKGKATIVSPEDLPECDVLVLDCEGVEKEILEEMEIRPRVLIVETHGMYVLVKARSEKG